MAGNQPQRPETLLEETPALKVVFDCPRQCAFSVEVAGSERQALALEWTRKGWSQPAIRREAAKHGWMISNGSISRHMARHVKRYIDPQLDPATAPLINPEKRLSDLEIIERIIQKGAHRLLDQEVRVTPDMLMKALDLKMKLTQGSVFDPLFEALAQAMTEDGDGQEAKA